MIQCDMKDYQTHTIVDPNSDIRDLSDPTVQQRSLVCDFKNQFANIPYRLSERYDSCVI
jgi:hypothetical protein